MRDLNLSGARAATIAALAASLVPAAVQAEPTPPGGLTNNLVPASACQNCHMYGNADAHVADPLYAPFLGWQGSMMGNAARDPVFWAGVAIASQDHADETFECIRCHSPRAFLENRGDAIAIEELTPEDLEGVTCEVCHRALEDVATPPGNAAYDIDDTLMNGTVPRRGPFTYDGAFVPPHSWIQDDYVGSSRLCGTCHDVTTPRTRVDDAGTSLGVLFNEQRTYSEWLNSSFSVPGNDFRSCQDCHMPEVADFPGCQDAVNNESHPTGGRRHDLVGANRFMVEILRGEYGSEGLDQIADQFFDASIARMDELLAGAATLDVAAPLQVDLADGLPQLEATVTNQTGHKLPTGYSEGRVMWLEVVATYAGETVWSSGVWDPATGIQQDDQLRTYEGIAEELATGTTLHLLLNDHWVEDTRIPPRGLQPDLETDPVGDRYTLQDDGTWPNFDAVTYAFPAARTIVDATPADATDDQLEIRVRLLYLINTASYIQFLDDTNVTNAAGSHVAELFEAAGGAPPLVLAEQTATVPIVGFPGSESGTSGSDSGPGTLDDTADSGNTPTSTSPTGSSSGTETDGNPEDDGGGGCSCRSTGQPGAWWSLLGFGLVAVRRRRRTRSVEA